MGIKTKKLDYFPAGYSDVDRHWPEDEEGQIDPDRYVDSVARITIVPDSSGIETLVLSVARTAYTTSDPDTHIYCEITTSADTYVAGHEGTSDHRFEIVTEQGIPQWRKPKCTIQQNLVPGKSYYLWIYIDQSVSALSACTASLDDISASGTYLGLSTANCAGGNFGQSVNFTVTQLRDKTVSTQVYLKYSGGGQEINRSVYGPTKAEGTYTGSFTAELATFAPLFTSSMSGTLTLETVTRDGTSGATIGTTSSTVTLTFRNDDVKPTVASGWVSIAPYNSGMSSAISGYYIKSKSKVRATFTASKITYQYGASRASFSIVYENTETAEASAASVVSAKTVNTAQTAECRVTDSRGAYTTIELPLTITNYYTPSTNNEVERCDATGVEDEDENKFFVITTPNYASIDGKNTVTISVNYRYATGAYDPSTAANIVSNAKPTSGTIVPASGRTDGKYIFPRSAAVSPDSDYEVSVTITDLAGSSSTATYILSARNWAMKFNETGTSVAFGMAPLQDKALQIPADWDIRVGLKSFTSVLLDLVYPVGSIYISASSTSPQVLFGGTWTKIKDRFLLASGDTYTAGSTKNGSTVSLSVNNLPAHSHGLSNLGITTEKEGTGSEYSGYVNTIYHGKGYVSTTTNDTGGGEAFSIMPPYLVVNVWQRVQDPT